MRPIVSLRNLFWNLFYPRKVHVAPVTTTVAPGAITAVRVIIPTYKPDETLVALVGQMVQEEQVTEVVVVNDATPQTEPWVGIFSSLRALRQGEHRARLLLVENEKNLMCAGAVNEGIRRLSPVKDTDAVLIVNDDTRLHQDAVHAMVSKLNKNRHLGAVCAQVRVANAHANILTRLQRFEYTMFNVVRKADEGLLYGPLIMHGMTVLFRGPVLVDEAKGYDSSCIIEDYDLTVRIKKYHWHVALAERAIAATNVPETWRQLWRQRVRWYYGGLTVVRRHWKFLPAIFFDIVSHWVNIGLLLLLLLSFFFGTGEPYYSYYTLRGALLVFAFFGIALQWVFFIWIDKSKDWKDIVLRLLLLPEVYYYSVLSMIVFGSYGFYLYQSFRRRCAARGGGFVRFGDTLFERIGFTTGWGTK